MGKTGRVLKLVTMGITDIFLCYAMISWPMKNKCIGRALSPLGIIKKPVNIHSSIKEAFVLKAYDFVKFLFHDSNLRKYAHESVREDHHRPLPISLALFFLVAESKDSYGGPL